MGIGQHRTRVATVVYVGGTHYYRRVRTAYVHRHSANNAGCRAYSREIEAVLGAHPGAVDEVVQPGPGCTTKERDSSASRDGGGYGLIWPSLVDTKFRAARKRWSGANR
ncbi:hypothetical protein KM043_014395 [Ampulex compressa]|nr:hypothetical protein KM043_014395 [Ampulex compressa]